MEKSLRLSIKGNTQAVTFLIILIVKISANATVQLNEPNPPSIIPSIYIDGKPIDLVTTQGISFNSGIGIFKRSLDLFSAVEFRDSLSASIGKFSDSNGTQYDASCTINGRPSNEQIILSSKRISKLSISADLPVEGSYKANITFIYGGKLRQIPLTVTRTRLSPTIEASDTPVVRIVGTDKDVKVRFTLSEIAGQRLSISPELTQLLKSDDDKIKVGADYGSLTILDARGKPLKLPIPIDPTSAKTLQIQINGLKGTGEFTGTLRLSNTDSGFINKNFIIYRKENACVAIFFIAIGVLFSFFVRLYNNSGRPKMIRQRQIALALSEIDEAVASIDILNANENSVIIKLRRQLNEAYEQVAIKTNAQTETIVKEIDNKLDIFIRWVTTRKTISSFVTPEIQQPYLLQLMEVERVLMSPMQETEASGLIKKLDEIITDVRIKTQQKLADALMQFSLDLETSLNKIKSDEILQQLKNIAPKIDQAQKFLNNGDLEKSQTAFNETRLAYIQLMASNLLQSISNDLPHEFDLATWNELRKLVSEAIQNVLQATDSQQATKSYLASQAILLNGLKTNLIEYINRLVANQSLSTEQISRLENSLGQLQSLKLGIDENSFDEAWNAYELAKKTTDEMVQELHKVEGDMDLPVDTTPDYMAFAAINSDVPAFFELPFWDSVFVRKHDQKIDANKIGRKLFWYDLTFTAFILIIGITLGLKLLWIDNATWGTFNHYLEAILWGLGINQVSNSASDSVAGWTSKMAATKGSF